MTKEDFEKEKSGNRFYIECIFIQAEQQQQKNDNAQFTKKKGNNEQFEDPFKAKIGKDEELIEAYAPYFPGVIPYRKSISNCVFLEKERIVVDDYWR